MTTPLSLTKLYRLIFPALLFLQFHAAAQTPGSFAAKGDSAYSAKNYPLAIDYYLKEASGQKFSFAKKDIYYNIACSYALNGDKNNAWKYLNESLQAGYNDYAHILVDTDLNTLHNDKDWEKFPPLSKALQERIGDPLKAELVTTDIHNFWDAYDRVQRYGSCNGILQQILF